MKHCANITSIIFVNSDDLDERTRPSNFEKKIMIVIFFGINSLVLLDFVPNGLSLKSDYYINNILKQLEINTDAYEVKKIKKVVYHHFYNAPSHSSKSVK